VQNYIDDTGVQVADVVVGFRVLEGKTLDEIRADRRHTALTSTAGICTPASPSGTSEDKERLATRRTPSRHRAWRQRQRRAIAAFIADRIVRCHLKTMARMNVDYDLLTWEGDILRLKFWAQAFDVLKAKKAVYLAEEGDCRVLGHAIQEDLDESHHRIPNPARREAEGEEREKVIVRSNGVVTYVGKDIAYQFWKLGLLGRISSTAVFPRLRMDPLWATCHTAARPIIRVWRRAMSTTSSTCGSRTCRSC
jgi:arginyl-tRNA synthetase